MIDTQRWREECALFGIEGHPDAARYITLGLHAQQHRGQEASGILTYQEEVNNFHLYSDHGLVSDVFNDSDIIQRLSGSRGIGHNRYSTSPGRDRRNLQPFYADLAHSGIGLAHNGNLTNANALREKLRAQGTVLVSESDSEILIHLMARAPGSTLDRIHYALSQVEGAYSLLVMDETGLYAIRDPHGFRPLQIGRLGDGLVAASESCAFSIIGAEAIRDVAPGEIIALRGSSLTSTFLEKKAKRTFCLFEYIYFSRPDSRVDDRSVHQLRKEMGRALAKEHPVDCDIVSPVPDSGIPAALGFAEEANLPFDYGLIRNHYVGRTFIEPDDPIRHFGVKLKLTPNEDVLKGKKVALVDDSLVRGTTSKKIIESIRTAGAKEVHLRLSSPPIRYPCFYGVDTPVQSALLAARMDLEKIRQYLNADSLGFLSLEGLKSCMHSGPQGFCHACFSGNYPTLSQNQTKPAKARSRLVMNHSLRG